jgi:hypothetical protein
VLLIGADKHKSQYNLHAFAAAGEASWSAPVMCFDMMDRQIWSMDDLACFDLLATTADGTRLSLLVYRGGRLEVWTEQQQIDSDGRRKLGGKAKWVFTREIDHKLTELLQQLDRPSCFWSGEKGDTALVHCEERIYVAYLDTAALQDVTEHFHDLPRGMILPMEIEWPTFFVLRLGSLSVG